MSQNIVLACALLSFCVEVRASEPTPPQAAKELYLKNASRMFRIEVPKPGFVGSRNSFLPDSRGPAKKDEDFNALWVTVNVVDGRESEAGFRAVLRLDDGTEQGQVITKGRYFAYVDVSREGTRLVHRLADDGVGDDSPFTRGRLPSPLTAARPPALGFGAGDVDGLVVKGTGRGVRFRKVPAEQANGPQTVVAEVFDTQEALPLDEARPVRWFGAEIGHIDRDFKQLRIMYRETQQWKKPDDWLWSEMVRVDDRGNILMRCKEVHLQAKPGSGTEGVPGGKDPRDGVKDHK